jgi:hypothetical protein
MAKMTRHIGYIHGSKLEPFSPPCFCQIGGLGLSSTSTNYQKVYLQVTGKPYYYCYYCPAPKQKSSLLMAA